MLPMPLPSLHPVISFTRRRKNLPAKLHACRRFACAATDHPYTNNLVFRWPTRSPTNSRTVPKRLPAVRRGQVQRGSHQARDEVEVSRIYEMQVSSHACGGGQSRASARETEGPPSTRCARATFPVNGGKKSAMSPMSIVPSVQRSISAFKPPLMFTNVTP